MMFFMNVWALAFMSCGAYISGQWTEGMAFCTANPAVLVR